MPDLSDRPNPRSTEELLQSYYMGELSEENARILLQRLEEHPDYSDPYNGHLADGLWTHCLLNMLFQSGRSSPLSDFFDKELSKPTSVASFRFFSQNSWKSFYAYLAGAALLLVMISGLATFFLSGLAKRISVSPEHTAVEDFQADGSQTTESSLAATGVAKVRAVNAVQWSKTSELFAKPGDILGPGWLRIDSGSISLVFFSGASVTIDGPAEFRLINEDRAYCAFGEVYAEVPQQAIGFQIDVPQTKVVDLGTSFGLKVGKDQSVVHVITGEVELRGDSDEAKNFDNKLLERGESLVASGGGGIETHLPRIPVSEGDDFSDSSIAINMERIFRRQAKRLDKDPNVLARFDFSVDAVSDTSVVQGLGGGTLHHAELVPGRLAQWKAMRFDQADSVFQFDLPGQYDALTLATWIRVDRLRQKYNTVCSTHGFAPGAIHWYLLYDGSMEIQIKPDDTESNTIVFRTDQVVLPWIGSWSHLALTLDQKTRKTCVYLNGIQVFCSKNFDMSIPFQLGRVNLGNWTYENDQPTPTHHIRSLEARTEEFIFFNRSLTSKEIRELFMGDYHSPKP